MSSGGFADVFFFLTRIQVTVPSAVFYRKAFCGSLHFREQKTHITFCFWGILIYATTMIQEGWLVLVQTFWSFDRLKTVTLQIFTFAINITRIPDASCMDDLPTLGEKIMEHLGTGQNVTSMACYR